MWVREVDGRDMAVVEAKFKDGEIVETLVPLDEEIARRRAAKEARKAKAEAEQSPKPPLKPSVTPLEATLILARRGRKEILPKLRQVLDEHPELWQHFGNLALQAQESWLGLIAGKDLYLAESLRRHLDAMRTELAGPSPSPLDRLLVDRILACHVQVLYFEAMDTTDPTGENMRVARYRMDRRDQAHRHFLSAVKMLATVRNLVAKTNVIQVELLNPPMARSPAAPIMAGANGDEPKFCNGPTTVEETDCDAEAAKAASSGRMGKEVKEASVNAVRSRINGNRVGHLVGTVASGKGG